MRDHERLRKALGDLVFSLRYWNMDELFYTKQPVADAKKVLAETPETSEMERFKTRLWAVLYETDEDEHGVTWMSVPKPILDDLWAEFGYGGENERS